MPANMASASRSDGRSTLASDGLRALAERRKWLAVCHLPRYLYNAYDDTDVPFSIVKVALMMASVSIWVGGWHGDRGRVG